MPQSLAAGCAKLPDETILLSPRLSETAKTLLMTVADRVRTADGHRTYLKHHRARFLARSYRAASSSSIGL